MPSSPKNPDADGRVNLQQIAEVHLARLRLHFENAGILLCGSREVSERNFDEFRREKLPGGLAEPHPGFAQTHVGAQAWMTTHFLGDLLQFHAAYLEQVRQFCLLLEASQLDLGEEDKKAWLVQKIEKRPASLTESLAFLTEWSQQDLARAELLTDLESFTMAFAGRDAAKPLRLRLLRPDGKARAGKTQPGVEIFEKTWTAAQRGSLFSEIFSALFVTVMVIGCDIAEAVTKGAALRMDKPKNPGNPALATASN